MIKFTHFLPSQRKHASSVVQSDEQDHAFILGTELAYVSDSDGEVIRTLRNLQKVCDWDA